jgi:2-dehydro-3-deoxyphosphooctonate aldolase (KDO 8-P synthase)
MKQKILESIENIKNLDSGNFFLLAGPCIIEDEKSPFDIAEKLIDITDRLKIPFVFKSSYKKANRQKIDSFTGIGDEKALKVLRTIKEIYDIPIVTDIHSEEEAVLVSQIVDIIQIPAFLCRQTDLLTTAARTGRVINIKKGQFVSPESMKFAAQKVVDSGNKNVMLTERGTMFGYQDLIVDFRGIIEMQKTGFPVVIDITHSLQQPNLASGISGGRPDLIETIGRAGIAVGADGVFIETHPNPAVAKSDGANMLRLDLLEDLLKRLIEIKQTINKFQK